MKQLATSVVAGQHNGYNTAEAREVTARCVESYREHIRGLCGDDLLGRWYERIDSDDLLGDHGGRVKYRPDRNCKRSAHRR